MIVTEAELRDQLRRPVIGARILVLKEARFSPAAADFIKQWQLCVEEVTQLELEDYLATVKMRNQINYEPRTQFKKLTESAGYSLKCDLDETNRTNGNETRLNDEVSVGKNNPRIKLRGQVDSLQALVLMTQYRAKAEGYYETTSYLAQIASYCQELISAEYHERQPSLLELGTVSNEEIDRVTHHPRDELGITKLDLGLSEPEVQYWLNICRTKIREIEVLAWDIFDQQQSSWMHSICEGLNLLSRACHFIQLKIMAGLR